MSLKFEVVYCTCSVLKKNTNIESVALKRAVLSLCGSDRSVGPVGAQPWAHVVSVSVTFNTPPKITA